MLARLRKLNNYDPLPYINITKGCLIGRDVSSKRPIYIPWEKINQGHMQCLGATSSGKNVEMLLIAYQCMLAGQSLIWIDPKEDLRTPSALLTAAKASGKKLHFLHLGINQPYQFNLLAGCAAYEIAVSYTHLNQPILEICAYISKPLEVVAIYRKNEETEHNPPARYVGRLFLRPDHIFKLHDKGELSINEAVDTDSMFVYRFSEWVSVSKDMLVITSAEKQKFEEKYLNLQVEDKSDAKQIANCLNTSSPFYSDELGIAIEVWSFLSENHKANKMSIKEQARQCIDTRFAHKKLSDSAKERICTLINWQKEGGAPKS